MAYATQQDCIDKKGMDAVLAVADREHSGIPNATAIADALNDASSMMDGYMSERFDLPLTTFPTWANRICVDIAFFILADSGGSVTDTIQDRYDKAISFMRDVAKGIVGLGLPPDQMPNTDEAGEVKGGEVMVTSNCRDFTRCDGW